MDKLFARGKQRWLRIADWWYQWALRYLPAGMVARAMEAFIGVVCCVSGIGVLTKVSKPRAAEQFIPDPFFLLWGVALLIGGASLFAGVMSIKWIKPPLMFYIERVAVYRLGLRLLLLSTLLYAIAQFWVLGIDAAVSGGITLYFTLTCWARLITLGRE